MTEQPIEETAPVDPQIALLQEILAEQKKTATRLGWLAFFGTMSFLGGLFTIFTAF
jgi:hypothetical protein